MIKLLILINHQLEEHQDQIPQHILVHLVLLEIGLQIYLSLKRGYKPGRYSFNVRGGRCETCEGDGVITYEMHFLPDVYIPCDACKGSRYNRETLEIKFKNKNIADSFKYDS